MCYSAKLAELTVSCWMYGDTNMRFCSRFGSSVLQILPADKVDSGKYQLPKSKPQHQKTMHAIDWIATSGHGEPLGVRRLQTHVTDAQAEILGRRPHPRRAVPAGRLCGTGC